MGLRTRILLLVVFASLLLPAVAVSVYLILERERDIAEAKRNLAALARNAGVDLEEKIRGTTQLLFGLSQSRELDTDDKDACSAYLAEVLKQYPQYTGILTIKPNGELHCDSLRTGRKLILTDRAYFNEASKSTGPALDLVFGRLTGIAVMQVALGARDRRGELKFVLLASHNLDRFARQVANAQPYPNTAVVIWDRTGTIMAAHPVPQGEKVAGKPYPDSELFGFVRSAKSGDTAEAPSVFGALRVWGLGALPGMRGTGLRITLGVPKAELVAAADRNLRQALGFILGAFLLVFVAAWVLAEVGIRRPAARIMDVIARFGAGDLAARATPHGPRELAMVATQLNAALDAQGAAQAELRRSQGQLSLIYNAASDPMWLVEVEQGDRFRFISVNQAFWRVTGLTEAQVIGKYHDEFLPPSSHGIVREKYQEVLRTRHIVHYQEVADLPAGRRIGEITVIPIFNEAGAIPHLLGTAVDITARVQAEQALRDHTEQLRQLSRCLFEVEEAERRRLARELHDSIGHNITMLRMNLDLLRSDLPGERARETNARLADCQALLDKTTQLIRSVMADLRPPGLDELGLVTALTEHARQASGRTGFSATVSGTALTPRLPPAAEIALFRIAQEALINVAKHARATEATITLEAGPETVVMTISDNGSGFDPAVRFSQAIPNLGMINMRERADAIGGRLRVESAPGRGTRVIVETPRTAPSSSNQPHLAGLEPA